MESGIFDVFFVMGRKTRDIFDTFFKELLLETTPRIEYTLLHKTGEEPVRQSLEKKSDFFEATPRPRESSPRTKRDFFEKGEEEEERTTSTLPFLRTSSSTSFLSRDTKQQFP